MCNSRTATLVGANTCNCNQVIGSSIDVASGSRTVVSFAFRSWWVMAEPFEDTCAAHFFRSHFLQSRSPVPFGPVSGIPAGGGHIDWQATMKPWVPAKSQMDAAGNNAQLPWETRSGEIEIRGVDCISFFSSGAVTISRAVQKAGSWFSVAVRATLKRRIYAFRSDLYTSI